MSSRSRLPGNRVVRRRLHATQVIEVPAAEERPPVPNVRTHAQRYVAAFGLLVAFGTLLLALPWTTRGGQATPVVDAFFTAVSAASVTGLVTVDTQTHWNWYGQAVILLLIQAGGLGFMVGASIVLQSLRRGVSLRDTLLIQDGSPTLSLREAGDLSRRILRFTVTVEAIGAVLLTIRFAWDMPVHEALWQGIFHSISAFCNAGFDLQGGFSSLVAYDASLWINLTVLGLVQAGALSYMVFSDLWTERRWGPLSLDTKIVVGLNAVLLVTGAVAFLIVEWSAALTETPVWARPLSAVFQSVATRTAGFATVSFGEVHTATLFAWAALMMIGGASGSTAGGVKLTTLGVVITAVISTLRGQDEPQLFGRRISTALVFRAMAVIVLFMIVHFVTTLLLALSEDVFAQQNLNFIALFFEAMSALATVGLSTGITPSLTTAGKLILCFAMFFGRIGPLTAVYALQRRQRPTRYRFAEAPVRIG